MELRDLNHLVHGRQLALLVGILVGAFVLQPVAAMLPEGQPPIETLIDTADAYGHLVTTATTLGDGSRQYNYTFIAASGGTITGQITSNSIAVALPSGTIAIVLVNGQRKLKITKAGATTSFLLNEDGTLLDPSQGQALLAAWAPLRQGAAQTLNDSWNWGLAEGFLPSSNGSVLVPSSTPQERRVDCSLQGAGLIVAGIGAATCGETLGLGCIAGGVGLGLALLGAFAGC